MNSKMGSLFGLPSVHTSERARIVGGLASGFRSVCSRFRRIGRILPQSCHNRIVSRCGIRSDRRLYRLIPRSVRGGRGGRRRRKRIYHPLLDFLTKTFRLFISLLWLWLAEGWLLGGLTWVKDAGGRLCGRWYVGSTGGRSLGIWRGNLEGHVGVWSTWRRGEGGHLRTAFIVPLTTVTVGLNYCARRSSLPCAKVRLWLIMRSRIHFSGFPGGPNCRGSEALAVAARPAGIPSEPGRSGRSVGAGPPGGSVRPRVRRIAPAVWREVRTCPPHASSGVGRDSRLKF